MQQWISKIVDNIEINLKNVHLRYEDLLSAPGVVFAVGLTLESFEVTTWKLAQLLGPIKPTEKEMVAPKGAA